MFLEDDSTQEEENQEEQEQEAPADETETETQQEEATEESESGPDLAQLTADELRELNKELLDGRRKANAEAAKTRIALAKVEEQQKQYQAERAKAKRDAELAAMDEKGRLEAERDDALKQVGDQARENQILKIENQAIAVATTLGFNDPRDAAQAISPDRFINDGVVDMDAIDVQVQALAQEKPYLLKKNVAPKIPPSSRGNNALGTQPTANFLQTKAKTHSDRMKEFREMQLEGGRQGAINTAKAWTRMAEENPKVRSGEVMKEALLERGRRERGG